MSNFDWRPCGYGCGKPWRPFAGTRLTGHARCAIPDAAQVEILSRLESDPRLSQAALAAELGVTVGVLQAWIANARKIRARR